MYWIVFYCRNLRPLLIVKPFLREKSLIMILRSLKQRKRKRTLWETAVIQTYFCMEMNKDEKETAIESRLVPSNCTRLGWVRVNRGNTTKHQQQRWEITLILKMKFISLILLSLQPKSYLKLEMLKKMMTSTGYYRSYTAILN